MTFVPRAVSSHRGLLRLFHDGRVAASRGSGAATLTGVRLANSEPAAVPRASNPLNPLTGDVPVPEDPVEIDAALRAGRITYRIFPYFAWRYGDRGRMFTRSDSAWLAWLTRHNADRVSQQVLWLGSVLSNRGMPRWLLETHLIVLHRMLSRAVPAKRTEYDKLRRASRELAMLRHAVVDEAEIERVAGDFADAAGGGPERLVTGAGRLIICAVADQESGMKNAVPSLLDWILDVDSIRSAAALDGRLSAAERQWLQDGGFAATWSTAVEDAVDEARDAAGEPTLESPR